MATLQWDSKSAGVYRLDPCSAKSMHLVQKFSPAKPIGTDYVFQGELCDVLHTLNLSQSNSIKCVLLDSSKIKYKTRADLLEYVGRAATYAKSLLTNDGAICVFSDNKNVHYLKVFLDEVFGRKNFVTNVVLERERPLDINADIPEVHEHALIFAKSKDNWKPNPLPRTDNIDKQYKLEPDPDTGKIPEKGKWKFERFLDNALGKKPEDRPKYVYDIKIRREGVTHILRPPASKIWACREKDIQKKIDSGEVRFVKNRDGQWGANKMKFLVDIQPNKARNIFLKPTPTQRKRKLSAREDASRLPEVPETPGDCMRNTDILRYLLITLVSSCDTIIDCQIDSQKATIFAEMQVSYYGIQHECLKGVLETIMEKSRDEHREFLYFALKDSFLSVNRTFNYGITFLELKNFIWNHASRKIGYAPMSNNCKWHVGDFGSMSYFLIYPNGENKENTLTNEVLQTLVNSATKDARTKIVYAERCLVGDQTLRLYDVIFQQIPYDLPNL